MRQRLFDWLHCLWSTGQWCWEKYQSMLAKGHISLKILVVSIFPRHALPHRDYIHSISEVMIPNNDQHQHQKNITCQGTDWNSRGHHYESGDSLWVMRLTMSRATHYESKPSRGSRNWKSKIFFQKTLFALIATQENVQFFNSRMEPGGWLPPIPR